MAKDKTIYSICREEENVKNMIRPVIVREPLLMCTSIALSYESKLEVLLFAGFAKDHILVSIYTKGRKTSVRGLQKKSSAFQLLVFAFSSYPYSIYHTLDYLTQCWRQERGYCLHVFKLMCHLHGMTIFANSSTTRCSRISFLM
jgi:hypothetical protein